MWQRLSLLAVNGVCFQALYGASSAAAAEAGVSRSVATPWDAGMPYWPGLLWVYISSLPLLLFAFLKVPGRQSLRALSQRCLLTTALGTLVFTLWPLRVTPPISTTPTAGVLVELLSRMDGPYNQFPSLHVAYCVILWPALRHAIPGVLGRSALLVWLVVLAASTVLTRRHNLPDVAAGAALGWLALCVVPSERRVPWVSLHYAVAATSALVLGLTVPPLAPCIWLTASCAGVSLAYARHDNDFLRKQDGEFPAWVMLLYAPYLLGYALVWRWVRWRERGRAPVEQFTERVWIGRRLDDREAQRLPGEFSVIDLASELTATHSLRRRITHAFRLLDLLPPSAARLALIVDAIDAELARGRGVYVHCSMGYRRSREVAQAWQLRRLTGLNS